MTFHHYILTRFNLPIFFRLRNGMDVNACDEKYLEDRFGLFERYCMPSVMNQTCQNFKWLIFFDSRTPEVFRKRANFWHNRYNNIYVFYLDLLDYQDDSSEYIDLYNDYAQKIGLPPYESIETVDGERVQRIVSPHFFYDCIERLENNGVKPDFYITTRLDNDDAIHSTMVERIQDMFIKNPERCVYNYHFGYEYQLQKHVAEIRDFGNGHFTSLVEPSNKLFQSVFYWSHQHVGKFVKQYDLYNEEPMFVELIHGNNAGNKYYVRYRGLLRGFKQFEPSLFGYGEDMNTSLIQTISFLFRKDAFVEHLMYYARFVSRVIGVTYLYHKFCK